MIKTTYKTATNAANNCDYDLSFQDVVFGSMKRVTDNELVRFDVTNPETLTTHLLRDIGMGTEHKHWYKSKVLLNAMIKNHISFNDMEIFLQRYLYHKNSGKWRYAVGQEYDSEIKSFKRILVKNAKNLTSHWY